MNKYPKYEAWLDKQVEGGWNATVLLIDQAIKALIADHEEQLPAESIVSPPHSPNQGGTMTTLRISAEILAAAEECLDHEGDYVRAFTIRLARSIVAQAVPAASSYLKARNATDPDDEKIEFAKVKAERPAGEAKCFERTHYGKACGPQCELPAQPPDAAQPEVTTEHTVFWYKTHRGILWVEFARSAAHQAVIADIAANLARQAEAHALERQADKAQIAELEADNADHLDVRENLHSRAVEAERERDEEIAAHRRTMEMLKAAQLESHTRAVERDEARGSADRWAAKWADAVKDYHDAAKERDEARKQVEANGKAATDLVIVKAALPKVLRHHRDSQNQCVCSDCEDFRRLSGLE